jgi:glycosyltransferase involved in cell wall biosynthesis
MSLRIVVFDHPASWRALGRALVAAGHELVFYDDLASSFSLARADLARADAAIVTSTSVETTIAVELVLASRVATKTFYDLDPASTLAHLRAGELVPYVGPNGYADFDLVLSASGGPVLSVLEHELGAKRVRPLYRCVDPDVHFPLHVPVWACDFSYVGAFVAEQQATLDALFLEVARLSPDKRFILAGSRYPATQSVPSNVLCVDRIATEDEAALYGSANLTLDLTEAPRSAQGYCPSARLFEAAACGTPIVVNAWDGIETFFEPGSEVLVAHSTEDVLRALTLSPSERARIAAASRRRALAHHTSTTRARELVGHLTEATMGDGRWATERERAPRGESFLESR